MKRKRRNSKRSEGEGKGNRRDRYTGKERPERGYWATTCGQAPPHTSSATLPNRIPTPALTSTQPNSFIFVHDHCTFSKEKV